MRKERLRHRHVVVVRATDGRILVHRHPATPGRVAGRWDLAVGGVVTAGGPTTSPRELAGEVGVTGVALAPAAPALRGRRRPSSPAQTVCDGPFTFADGEVVEGFVTLPGCADWRRLVRARQRRPPDATAFDRLTGAHPVRPPTDEQETHPWA
jgi:hypothetical protein